MANNDGLTLDSSDNFTESTDLSNTKLATLDILSINKADIFTADDCDKIIKSCIEELWLSSKVIGDKKLHASKRQKLRGEVEGFPFEPIRSITKSANDQIYDFKLLGIIDQDFPQVFKYEEKDHYDWHIELTPVAPSRKLTFIVNLSDPSTYEGGQLEFLNTETDPVLMNSQGGCVVFPSFLSYRIKPVTKGTKYIIIGNVHGALFR
jgi:PKHD-type hydroxylase